MLPLGEVHAWAEGSVISVTLHSPSATTPKCSDMPRPHWDAIFRPWILRHYHNLTALISPASSAECEAQVGVQKSSVFRVAIKKIHHQSLKKYGVILGLSPGNDTPFAWFIHGICRREQEYLSLRFLEIPRSSASTQPLQGPQHMAQEIVAGLHAQRWECFPFLVDVCSCCPHGQLGPEGSTALLVHMMQETISANPGSWATAQSTQCSPEQSMSPTPQGRCNPLGFSESITSWPVLLIHLSRQCTSCVWLHLSFPCLNSLWLHAGATTETRHHRRTI